VCLIYDVLVTNLIETFPVVFSDWVSFELLRMD
jgi:hypothetical protein